jgi:glycosyltransferase involved in cell wall biosynthesis
VTAVRVAYLTGNYPAVSHTFIAREIRALRELGVEVVPFSLHTPDPSELLSDEDRREAEATRNVQPPQWGEVIAAHAAGLARHPVRYLRTLAAAQRLSPPGLRSRLWHLFYFAEAILMWRWMRRAGARHLHVHFANAASMVALLYTTFAAAEGASYSFTMHGPTEFDEVERFRLREKVAGAAFVACISDYARAQLMRLADPADWERLEIVHCGVDTARWEPREARPEGTGLRLLTVARLAPDKGIRLLLEAMASVTADGLDVTLEIVGDGPDRDRLEARSAELGLGERVRFTGAVGRDRIRERYEAADAFCLSSFAEGVPVVLMEAMALERPVIAPRVMGIPELVEDGVSGVLVAPGSVPALAAAIRRLAEAEPAALAELGAAGRARVRGSYELADSARRLEELFANAGSSFGPSCV